MIIKHEDDGYWIEFNDTITSHHEEVFACFTTPVGLSRWFPVNARIELRTGGQIVFGWDEQFTRTTTIAILEYDAGGSITWDWYAGVEDRHAPITWRVEPHVEKGAIVHFRQGPFPEEISSLISMAEEAASWRWQLCNLRAVLEVSHDMRKTRPL